MLYSKVQGQVQLKSTFHKNNDIHGGSRVPDGLTTTKDFSTMSLNQISVTLCNTSLSDEDSNTY